MYVYIYIYIINILTNQTLALILYFPTLSALFGTKLYVHSVMKTICHNNGF